MSARSTFAERLTTGAPILVPLALDPLTARMCAAVGFEAVYLSGGALGYQYAVSEALLTLTEITDVARRIVRRCDLPLIVDGGVGFGDAVHVARTIWDVEATGAAAIEIEDQVAPKRVSHHRGVEHLVSTEEMTAKIRFAVEARTDPDFVIIARTGAVKNESFAAAVDRANAYADAGADAVLLMPTSPQEWEQAPAAVRAPLVSFSSLAARPVHEWAELGWRVILDPFSAQVMAHEAIESSYRAVLAGDGLGRDAADIMEGYERLPAAAGLSELYDIERATTERGT